uniref:Uncharacterized protein n=1 Tax=Tetranychus urticae TaxID=32264 RepID=T1KGW9_TETUR
MFTKIEFTLNLLSSHLSRVFFDLEIVHLNIFKPILIPLISRINEILSSQRWPYCNNFKCTVIIPTLSDVTCWGKSYCYLHRNLPKNSLLIFNQSFGVINYQINQTLLIYVTLLVVVLRNMVGVEDIDDALDSKVTEQMCNSQGKKLKLLIHSIILSFYYNCNYNYYYYNFIFNQFNWFLVFYIFFYIITEAIVARDSLNGRFFGGRIVKAEIYDQTLYDEKDLSG